MRARRSLSWEPLGNALGDLGGLTVLDGALPWARMSSAKSSSWIEFTQGGNFSVRGSSSYEPKMMRLGSTFSLKVQTRPVLGRR